MSLKKFKNNYLILNSKRLSFRFEGDIFYCHMISAALTWNRWNGRRRRVCTPAAPPVGRCRGPTCTSRSSVRTGRATWFGRTSCSTGPATGPLWSWRCTLKPARRDGEKKGFRRNRQCSTYLILKLTFFNRWRHTAIVFSKKKPRLRGLILPRLRPEPGLAPSTISSVSVLNEEKYLFGFRVSVCRVV